MQIKLWKINYYKLMYIGDKKGRIIKLFKWFLFCNPIFGHIKHWHANLLKIN